ncbi:hypothetical protein diail_5279 [Diaporthe ilicicola]|nr:hypothetical protein diail_5279 [Diaporthe ilicicola]
MAQTHLPFAAIQALPDSYWQDEASVNGIWNGLIAAAYPGTVNQAPAYVIQPEGQSQTTSSRKRNDLLVRQVVGDPRQGKLIIRLAFEGKSSASASSLEAASGQLSEYLKATGSQARGGDKVWCVVVRGTQWKAYQYMSPLLLNGQKPVISTSTSGQVMDIRANPQVALNWLRWFQQNTGNRAVLTFN